MNVVKDMTMAREDEEMAKMIGSGEFGTTKKPSTVNNKIISNHTVQSYILLSTFEDSPLVKMNALRCGAY